MPSSARQTIRTDPDGAAARMETANGFLLLRRFFDRATQARLVAACHEVARLAPFITPGMPRGRPFRVEMTNAGEGGWLSDPSGYRHARRHPLTRAPWPAAPPALGTPRPRAGAAAVGGPA